MSGYCSASRLYRWTTTNDASRHVPTHTDKIAGRDQQLTKKRVSEYHAPGTTTQLLLVSLQKLSENF
jgi:hypothetical protein